VQFNERRFQDGDYIGPSWLQKDVELISEKARIGFFPLRPAFWMFGEIEPLKDLQDARKREAIIARILKGILCLPKTPSPQESVPGPLM
jgi:hypothetical protein